MKHVNCNICEADKTKFCFTAKDRNSSEKILFYLVKCTECGLIYLNPRPDEEEILKFYPPWYHARAENNVAEIEKSEIWGIPWREAMAKKAEPILKYKTNGRILDIGCGDGSLLKYLKEKGWEAYGLDFQEASARYARENLKLNVSTGRVEEIAFPEESFDIIILFHVLEHLDDPSNVLKKVKTLLKKDGYLLIEVPNIESFESRLFRSKWVGISAPLHLYHFSRKSLKSMLEKCGYETIEVEFIPEQTKYVAGFSESLRYMLSDVGLYHTRKKTVTSNENKSNSNQNELDIFRLNAVHFLEYKIFKCISHAMDAMGMGSNLLIVSQKIE